MDGWMGIKREASQGTLQNAGRVEVGCEGQDDVNNRQGKEIVTLHS